MRSRRRVEIVTRSRPEMVGLIWALAIVYFVAWHWQNRKHVHRHKHKRKK